MIVIEGMEMPKGELGAIPIMIYANGNVEHFFSHEKYGKVIEVPEPHGRLIDADAVSLEGGPYEYDEWCKWALEQYQDAPTVIQASEGET